MPLVAPVDGAWTSWCRFFLAGVTDQAERNMEKAESLLALYEELKPLIVDATRSQYAIHALDWVFDRPIFSSTDFVANAQIPDSTARRILGVFKDEGLLNEIRPAAGRRPATLTFPRLLNIAEGRAAF